MGIGGSEEEAASVALKLNGGRDTSNVKIRNICYHTKVQFLAKVQLCRFIPTLNISRTFSSRSQYSRMAASVCLVNLKMSRTCKNRTVDKSHCKCNLKFHNSAFTALRR